MHSNEDTAQPKIKKKKKKKIHWHSIPGFPLLVIEDSPSFPFICCVFCLPEDPDLPEERSLGPGVEPNSFLLPQPLTHNQCSVNIQ